MHLKSSLFGFGGEHGKGEVVVGAGRVLVVSPSEMAKHREVKSVRIPRHGLCTRGGPHQIFRILQLLRRL